MSFSSPLHPEKQHHQIDHEEQHDRDFQDQHPAVVLVEPRPALTIPARVADIRADESGSETAG
jgi:hypothetical protein